MCGAGNFFFFVVFFFEENDDGPISCGNGFLFAVAEVISGQPLKRQVRAPSWPTCPKLDPKPARACAMCRNEEKSRNKPLKKIRDARADRKRKS